MESGDKVKKAVSVILIVLYVVFAFNAYLVVSYDLKNQIEHDGWAEEFTSCHFGAKQEARLGLFLIFCFCFRWL